MLEKWHCTYTIITVLVIFVNYTIIRLKLSDYGNINPPMIKSNNDLLPLRQCCNALFCSLEGEWHARPNLTIEDFVSIDNSNMDLRIKKGWPNKLYHGDMRCGTRYPLPRLLRTNRSKVHVLDIKSQCKPFSMHPCCREDIGWCGRGEIFCNCKSCVNYNTLMYAELFNWTPKNNCRVRDLYPKDTCWFLQRHFSSVTFIGDSLVRHIFSALLMHLTGDFVYGALKPNETKHFLEFCKGESQFVDSSCHAKLATKWDDIKSNKNYCSSLNKKVKLSFTQAFNIAHARLAISAMEEAFQEDNSLVLIGIGVHDQFNATGVINEYLRPIVDFRNMHNKTKLNMVWFSPHAAGFLKPLMFQKTQGNENILLFNLQIREFCRKNDIIVFDTFNLTVDVHSFDGTHYGSELNLLKVKLLVDGLMSMSNYK